MTTLETYGQGTYGSELYGDDVAPLASWGNALDGTWGGGLWGGPALQHAEFMVEVERRPGVWEDVTCDVRTIAVDRGRSRQLDSFSAATMGVELADADDSYNAWNPVGIWSDNGVFRTDVPIRVRIRYGSSTYNMFTGTTDDVADSWPGAGADSLTQVRATDGMKLLARARPVPIAAAGAGELPGVRVNRVLDAISYTGPRNVENGSITMAATTLDGTAVDLCDEARESEWGNFYVDSSGTVRFRARDSVVTDPRQAQVQWVFTDRHGDDLTSTTRAVAPILLEPFDTLAAWTATGAPTIVPGRTGTSARMVAADTIAYTIPAASESSVVIVGFAINPGPLVGTGNPVVQFRSDAGATQHILFRAQTDGSMMMLRGGVTQVGVLMPAGTLVPGVWQYIEVRMVLGDSPNGAWEVRKDGTVVASAASVDTKNAGTKTTFDRVWLSGFGTGASLVDDLYLSVGTDAIFQGPITIAPEPPVVSDSPTGCYSDLKLIATDEAVYNRVSIQRVGASTPQVASIADSLAWYGPRTYTRTNMSVADDTGALTLAQTIAAQHAYNERRVDEIVFYPLAEPDLLAIAVGVRMLDRVRVIRHTGVVIDAELQVQAIHHTITGGGDGHPGTWECRLETTNALVVRDAGQWDVGGWDVAKWSV